MNELKPFAICNDEGSWRTSNFRQSVVAKIDEAIQRSGMPTSRNSIEMESHVFQKAKSKEDYLSMIARLILHVREMNTKKPMMSGPNAGQVMQGGPSPQPGGPQGPNQGQPGQQDPINALQNLASQGSRNPQMMQGGMGPGPMGMQQQMGPQGPMVSQGQLNQQNPPITATNLLQTLNQRPQMPNMQQLQNKMGPGMGMVTNQGQMGNMVGPMAQIAAQMGNQMQGQMGGPNMQSQMGGPNMQGQMGPNMSSMPNQMGSNQMGPNQMGPNQMGPNQMGPNQMGSNQMGPNQMGPSHIGPNQMGPTQMGPNQMGTNQMGPNQMGPNQMGSNQMGQLGSNSMAGQMQSQMGNMGGVGGQMSQAQISMMQHMQQQRGKTGEAGLQQMLGGVFPRGPAPGPAQFLRQSPSPSAPSPGMPGPSPASMGVMGGAMSSPLSMGGTGGVASPVLAPSPGHHAPPPHSQQHAQQHMQQPQRMSMAPSPSSSLNTPLGAGGAAPSPLAPGTEEQAYRDKVRQLSKYIEPLRRMILRMVNDGRDSNAPGGWLPQRPDAEKLTKMKNLLEILSNPSKRMPLETLIKCEIVLEKLDFKRGELPVQPNSLQLHGTKEHQIFNPLLEVVNNCLQSPLANHTLKRTFGPCLEALNGPEIRNMPPPLKIQKAEEATSDIPDVLQGEIARLDSRFKVSLETLQLSGVSGAISLLAHLDDGRLPCVPPVQVCVPAAYPASPPSARPAAGAGAAGGSFLTRVEGGMGARLARLPRGCSVGQLLDAWEMSVRQACAPRHDPSTDDNTRYTPVPALGI